MHYCWGAGQILNQSAHLIILAMSLWELWNEMAVNDFEWHKKNFPWTGLINAYQWSFRIDVKYDFESKWSLLSKPVDDPVSLMPVSSAMIIHCSPKWIDVDSNSFTFGHDVLCLIFQLFKMYSSNDPPPVDLIRSPHFLRKYQFWKFLVR